MKLTDKEINKKISELEAIADHGSMGSYKAYEKINALKECLRLDEDEIEGKIEDIIDSDYDLYAVYDWAIGGRDDC